MRLSASHLGRRLAAIGISVALLLPVIGVAPVAGCTEGCTPGYWKNHTDMWPAGYTTGMSVYTAGFRFPGAAGITMLEALQGGGGPGLPGARLILIRAAVAALLNAVALDAMVPDTVLVNANSHFASLDRATMIAQAEAFDEINNLYCPLN
jgi:hypothetical protein